MAIAPVNSMSIDEMIEYIESLENENRQLRRKTDNRKKLTAIEVRQIRELAAEGLWSNEELGLEYGVNAETVRRTANRTYHRSVR